MTLPLHDVSALTDAEVLAFAAVSGEPAGLDTENRIWDKIDIGRHHPASCGDHGECVHSEAAHAIWRRAVSLQSWYGGQAS